MNPQNLGMGVMIGLLGGDEASVKAFTAALNKTITQIKLSDKALVLTFEDDSKLTLSDEGQSCCEHRYLHCDDKLDEFIGGTFLGAEVKDAPSASSEYGEHEICFLDVKTSKGVFQICAHNEHNGYYGGFLIRAS